MTVPATPVAVRAYAAGDGPATVAVFLDAVTITAAAHYSPEQIAAWSAPEERDLDAWDRDRAARGTVVAVLDGHIAGFSDVTAEGYIHMLFVSPRFARRGVAGALLSEDERRARTFGASTLSTNASITARAFFERHGFTVVTEQHPVTRGVRMTNYRMLKRLS
jgi:putative acetyltransferase